LTENISLVASLNAGGGCGPHELWQDSRWHFKKGNPGGPGRPPRETERGYLKVMLSKCTAEVWEQITARAIKDALKGDAPAREWLSKYLLGRPMAVTPSPTEMVVEEALGIPPLPNTWSLTRIRGRSSGWCPT
jgi:hypothetical protein